MNPQPTHVALTIEDANRLMGFFMETPMPRTQSDPFVEILRRAQPVAIPEPNAGPPGPPGGEELPAAKPEIVPEDPSDARGAGG